MVKSLEGIRKKINPAVLQAAEIKAREMMASMPLQELCNNGQLPHEQLVEILRA